MLLVHAHFWRLYNHCPLRSLEVLKWCWKLQICLLRLVVLPCNYILCQSNLPLLTCMCICEVCLVEESWHFSFQIMFRNHIALQMLPKRFTLCLISSNRLHDHPKKKKKLTKQMRRKQKKMRERRKNDGKRRRKKQKRSLGKPSMPQLTIHDLLLTGYCFS